MPMKQLILILFFLPVMVSAQSLGSPLDTYRRLNELLGHEKTVGIRVGTLSKNDLRSGVWKDWVPGPSESVLGLDVNLGLETRTSYNSTYARGLNDTSQWQGRGWNGFLKPGVEVDHEWFHVSFFPEIWTAQNSPFSILPPHPVSGSEFGYFAPKFDLPQRYGDDVYGDVNWGDSGVYGRWKPFYFGLTQQTFWLGPAGENPVLMGGNAAGIPRLTFGFETWETPAGLWEFTAWVGRTAASDFYEVDRQTANLFEGFAFTWAPPFLEGLKLGANRIIQSNWKNFSWESLLLLGGIKMSSDMGKDVYDQRISLTGEWIFPEVGFRAYGEWGKNDYSAKWRYFLRAPEHSQAYTLGFWKVQALDAQNLLLLRFELSDFIHSLDYSIDLGTSQGQGFYNIQVPPLGYTHLGQMIAGGVGPGSDTQFLGIDWYFSQGWTGISLRRINRNKDWIYGDPDKQVGVDIDRMNVEFAVTLQGGFWVQKGLLLHCEGSIAQNINWNYIARNDKINIGWVLGLSSYW